MPARKRTRTRSKRGGEGDLNLYGSSSLSTPTTFSAPIASTQQPSIVEETKKKALAAWNTVSAAMSGGYKRKTRRSKRHMKGGDFVPNTSSYGSTASSISGVPSVIAQMIGGKSRKRRSHRHSKACKHGKSRKCRKSRRH